jgi:hypothetical protein
MEGRGCDGVDKGEGKPIHQANTRAGEGGGGGRDNTKVKSGRVRHSVRDAVKTKEENEKGSCSTQPFYPF